MIINILSRIPSGTAPNIISSAAADFEYLESMDLERWFDREVDKIKLGKKNQTGLSATPDELRIFVKRYQLKGPVRIIDFLLTGNNRAAHCYNISRKLLELGVPVPEPLAAITDMSARPPCLYYICEALTDFVTLRKISKTKIVEKQNLFGLITCIAKLAAKMHKSGIVHGDLKWPNIMATTDLSIIKFIDLDNAREISFPNNKLYTLDIARFAVDMAENMPEPGLFSAFMGSYAENSSIDAEQLVKNIYPYYRKISRKHEKKYGRSVPALSTLNKT